MTRRPHVRILPGVLCAALIALGAIAPQAVAQTITTLFVDAAASTGGDGTSWTSGIPYKYLQDAIDRAVNIDPQGSDRVLILVRSKWSGGIGIYKYYPDEDETSGPSPNHVAGDPEESFYLRDRIELYLGFDGTESSAGDRDTHRNGRAILSGDLDGDDAADFVNYDENTNHVVVATDVGASAIIEGFVIEHGYAQFTSGPFDAGGGILLAAPDDFSDPATPTIFDCIIQDNWSLEAGAGIAAPGIGSGTTLDIRACVIQGNKTYQIGSGGLYASGGGICRLVNVNFIGNHASNGDGGGALIASRAQVINCQYLDNTASSFFGQGGGLHLDNYNTAEVTNSIFSGNSAAYGGGIYIQNQFVLGATGIFTNCTLTANNTPGQAGGGGGGMYVHNEDASGILLVSNAIVWDNTSSSASLAEDQIYRLGTTGTFTVTYSDVEVETGLYPGDVYPGTGNINDIPDFRSPSNLYLQYGSPCIDAGNNSLLPADVADLDEDSSPSDPLPEDINGADRVQDGDGNSTATVDMGAYELAPPSTCAADINGNCTVNGVDLALILSAWGPCSSCDEDLNGDGMVNGFDLAILLGMWGPCEDCESLFGGGEEEDEDYPLLLTWLLSGDFAAIFEWAGGQ